MEPPVGQLQRFLAASGGRMYLGAVKEGLALSEPQHSVLVLGPPRSGKTTALAVPNALCAPGALVVTSTKPDILAATLPTRAAMGRCWLFDPSGTVEAPAGVETVRWSPVEASRTWDETLVVARSMTGAARPAGRAGESAHWTERAEALLAPLLHAAHLEGSGMAAVAGWALRQDLSQASAVLRLAGHGLPVDVLAGIDATDPREQSGIWSSLAGVLAAYRSEKVLESSSPVNFDPAGLVGTSDTVYVCAPSRHQQLVAPITVAFLDRARAGCWSAWTPGRVPLTFVLDELANIAPIPDLPSLLSEGGSQGLQVLGCLQDLSQARARWGAAADGFVSLFGSKVVLPGIGDLATLELLSRLGGEVDVPARSVSRGPWWGPGAGARTVTWAPHRQRRLPVDAVAHQEAGTALVLSGARPPTKVRLPPWWAVRELSPDLPAPGPLPGTDRGRGAGLAGGRG